MITTIPNDYNYIHHASNIYSHYSLIAKSISMFSMSSIENNSRHFVQLKQLKKIDLSNNYKIV
jgi:hypothetical protein